MTKDRFFSSLVLLAVILTACAPATSTTVPVVEEPSATVISIPTAEASATPSIAATDTLVPSSPTPSSDLQPVATSRGPNLEASDPATVNLASGGLQLVEFFRFT